VSIETAFLEQSRICATLGSPFMSRLMRPLGYMSMEISDDLEGAKLTLQLWPGGQVHDVGRADFHGRWVKLGSSHIG
jgi:hypothetical protein